jgi:hypothetical protein
MIYIDSDLFSLFIEDKQRATDYLINLLYTNYFRYDSLESIDKQRMQDLKFLIQSRVSKKQFDISNEDFVQYAKSEESYYKNKIPQIVSGIILTIIDDYNNHGQGINFIPINTIIFQFHEMTLSLGLSCHETIQMDNFCSAYGSAIRAFNDEKNHFEHCLMRYNFTQFANTYTMYETAHLLFTFCLLQNNVDPYCVVTSSMLKDHGVSFSTLAKNDPYKITTIVNNFKVDFENISPFNPSFDDRFQLMYILSLLPSPISMHIIYTMQHQNNFYFICDKLEYTPEPHDTDKIFGDEIKQYSLQFFYY